MKFQAAFPNRLCAQFKQFGKFSCPLPIKGLPLPQGMTEIHAEKRRSFAPPEHIS
ncbi:MAG: hypothetical protein WBX30_03265 [Stellaceae bacterium]